MFTRFFADLRAAGIPASLREYLTFLGALRAEVVLYDAEGFYFLARAALVKDERHTDRFDRVFAACFGGLLTEGPEAMLDAVGLPEDWLRKLAEKHLTPEERAEIEALGGFEALMRALRERLAEQTGRHQGGNKWIGTAGTSPFGAHGYNPEGVRIGQDESRHQRAVKVWDRRDFRDFDDTAELNTRAIKIALRRLRRWAREGAADELDLPGTIRATAQQGWLDVVTRPERRNAVKVLLFLDVGGSMDAHVQAVEELFSAARSEFKHLEHYYFHNCLYDRVWRENRRRWDGGVPTAEVLRTYGADYRCVFVGDATMSPYEITHVGGANEHWNEEPGAVWLGRALAAWPHAVWINPVREDRWARDPSVGMIGKLMDGRMVPLTLAGIEAGIRTLTR